MLLDTLVHSVIYRVGHYKTVSFRMGQSEYMKRLTNKRNGFMGKSRNINKNIIQKLYNEYTGGKTSQHYLKPIVSSILILKITNLLYNAT